MTAIGTAAIAMAMRGPARCSVKYPSTTASMNNDIRERMPEQASATSSALPGKEEHVAFAQHRDAARRNHDFAQLRGQHLKRKRHLIEDDRGQRNHQQQECDRERQRLQVCPSREEQHQTGDDTDHRDAREEELRAVSTGNEDTETEGEQGDPCEMRTDRKGWPARSRRSQTKNAASGATKKPWE